ncbi:MAG: hypothetical protein EXX96DRAFT_371855 [Benjaminiella poitrasii]|nr:MAG: hypothetical protein EXX96DRAFT_371855 [Benjaminiella poitrasii]
MLFTTFNNRLIALAILIQLLRSNAQDTSGSNIDAASNGTNSTDRPADLPFVGWTILRIDPSSRENLCQRQIAYCTNTCGGPSNVSRK